MIRQNSIEITIFIIFNTQFYFGFFFLYFHGGKLKHKLSITYNIHLLSDYFYMLINPVEQQEIKFLRLCFGFLASIIIVGNFVLITLFGH